MSMLDDTTRNLLLRAAREAIAADLAGDLTDAPRQPPAEPHPLIENHGVFVTLRKRGHLRGCIGTFSPSPDLFEVVRTMAVAAAHDPRFVNMPLGAREMSDLRIDISVLSPRRVLDDPLDFEIGVHGVYVRHGHQAGCFLPEVAAERNWDQATFLTECCRQKGGLEPLAWKEDGAEVSVFTVEKLCDHEPHGAVA